MTASGALLVVAVRLAVVLRAITRIHYHVRRRMLDLIVACICLLRVRRLAVLDVDIVLHEALERRCDAIRFAAELDPIRLGSWSIVILVRDLLVELAYRVAGESLRLCGVALEV